MSEAGTYITLSRSITDHWIWSEKPFDKGRAWIDLLLRARWKDGQVLYRGNVVERKRGTVYCSLSFLAQEWGWHRQTVKRFLEQLEVDGMVRLNVTKRDTAIVIENYNKYQLSRNEECTTDCTSDCTSDYTSDPPQKKKDKKGKKDKNNIYSAAVHAIVAHLDEVTGRNYDADSDSTAKPIRGRLRDGYTVDDCLRVIDVKAQQWLGDAKMDKFLRPKTLFGKDNFEEYVKERPTTGNIFADALMFGEMNKEELPF